MYVCMCVDLSSIYQAYLLKDKGHPKGHRKYHYFTAMCDDLERTWRRRLVSNKRVGQPLRRNRTCGRRYSVETYMVIDVQDGMEA